jgi:hypothetical protein
MTTLLAAAPASAPSGLPSPARRRDFWLFWAGETVSNLGSSFTQFALPLLVFQLTGSALNLGLATAATFLPYLLFGLVIGAWVDRLDRKRLMIGIDGLLALSLATIPLLAFLGLLSVWWMYGVSFVSTTLKVGFEAGQFAAIPSLVDQDHLVTANGRVQASFSAASILGPLLAGMLLFVLPLPTLLFIDAASFLVSASTLSLIHTSFNAAKPRERTSVRQDMVEGLRTVFTHPVLRLLSLLTPLANLLLIGTLSQLVLLATVRFRAAGWQLSVLYAVASGGLLLGSLLAAPLRKHASFSQVIVGAVVGIGVLLVALAVTPWYWLGVLLWGAKSGLEVLFNLNTMSLRQAIVPNHLLGRVGTSARVLAYGTAPLGSVLGGLLVAWGGPASLPRVYATAGVLLVLLALGCARTALGHAERFLPDAMGSRLVSATQSEPAPGDLAGAPAVGWPPPSFLTAAAERHKHCPACGDGLPLWARYCGSCGCWQVQAPGGIRSTEVVLS